MNASDCTIDAVVIGEPPIDQLEAHLHCHLGGRIRDLRLVAERGSVILRGHAPTYYAKQLAQHALMEATGLPVINEIEVS